jgi:hypothetical protein
MCSDQIAQLVRLEVDDDALTARLLIAPGLKPDALDELTLRALVSERGLPFSASLAAAIQHALAAFRNHPDAPLAAPLAQGTAPIHGTPGRLVFEPGLDPADTDSALRAAAEASESGQPATGAHDEPDAPSTPDAESAPSPDSTDHYSRCVIRTVQPGQVIARLIPPGPATDGLDVYGRSIPAKPGLPEPVTTDDSAQLRSDGTIIALRPGRVERRGGEGRAQLIRVSDRLVIPGSVDFSTGHVDFPGHLLVRRGVRDRFRLSAGRSITVEGLVEAATLHANLDAILTVGMAARDQGTLTTGRDATARYLNSVRATIGRDLCVENEITGCTLAVGRHVKAPHCSITGGSLVAGGSIEVGTLGSEAGVPTLVRPGVLPGLADLLPALLAALSEADARVQKAEDRLKQLQLPGAANQQAPRLTATHAEELTELQFELARLRAPAAKLRARIDRLHALAAQHAQPVLIVRERVYPGTRVGLGSYTIQFTRETKGPFRLSLDPSAPQSPPVLIDLLTNQPVNLNAQGGVGGVGGGGSPESVATSPSPHTPTHRSASRPRPCRPNRPPSDPPPEPSCSPLAAGSDLRHAAPPTPPPPHPPTDRTSPAGGGSGHAGARRG